MCMNGSQGAILVYLLTALAAATVGLLLCFAVLLFHYPLCYQCHIRGRTRLRATPEAKRRQHRPKSASGEQRRPSTFGQAHPRRGARSVPGSLSSLSDMNISSAALTSNLRGDSDDRRWLHEECSTNSPRNERSSRSISDDLRELSACI